MPTTINGTTGVNLVQDGTVATADIVDGAVTAAKLSGAQTGSAPIYGCRAWCSFAGATGALTSGGGSVSNVSSVTRNGAGNYTVNFATVMPDAAYTVVLTTAGLVNIINYQSKATGSVGVLCYTTAGAGTDGSDISVAVFR